jgi:hemoglobin-like flavoprotein
MKSIPSNVKKAAEVYNESLERCVAHGGFVDRFYELFLGSSEEVAEKFKNTDFVRQKEALRASLYIMMMAHCWSVECDSHFEEIATRHSRSDLDIRPGLYDLWLNCLLQAVRETDPLFSLEVEAAWKNTLEPGIEFMKSRY